MKRFRILLLLLFVAGTLSAQESVVTREKSENSIKVTKVLPKRVDKHDFRIAMGSFSLVNSFFLDGFSGESDPVVLEPNFRNDMALADTYISDRRFIGNYSFSYVYHSRRWFQIGGTLTFAAMTQSRRNSFTNKRVESFNDYSLSIMPTARFVYLYREKVQLYSSVSLGVVVGTSFAFPWGDMTLIGCSFGKNIFGFAELGCGVGGWGRVGLGYRFDATKKGKK